MQSAKRSAAPLALPGRVVVAGSTAASAVGAVILMIAVRRARDGGSKAGIRYAVVGVLKVAGIVAMMMLLQEAVVRNRRRHPAVGGHVSVDVRGRLIMTVADFADRPVR